MLGLGLVTISHMFSILPSPVPGTMMQERSDADKDILMFFSSIQRQHDVMVDVDETKSSKQLHNLLSQCTSHTLSVRQQSDCKEYYVAGKIEIFLQGKKRKLWPPPYTLLYKCFDETLINIHIHPRLHKIVVVGTCIRATHGKHSIAEL